MRAYADPNHPGNRLRPKVRCLGCGKLGCITYWGDWCFICNVERINRIDAMFAPVRDHLDEHEADAAVKICDMAGVREHGEGAMVELWRNGRGRLVIVAYNECGNNTTEVDLWDVIDWLFDGKGQSGVAEVIRQGEEK